MVTPTNHVIARAGLALRGAPGTIKIFAISFYRIYSTVGENQKSLTI